MVIRLAETRDIPDMIALLYQVGGVHHDIRPDIFRSGAIKYTPEDLENLLKEADKPIFVCDDGGFVAGYCFCQIREYKDSTVLTDRKELYIDDLCVDENCRGKGVATELYRHVTAYAKDFGCAFITLNVWTGNDKAQRFYEFMGMTPRNMTMEISL